jgi:hypothetical protein
MERFMSDEKFINSSATNYAEIIVNLKATQTELETRLAKQQQVQQKRSPQPRATGYCHASTIVENIERNFAALTIANVEQVASMALLSPGVEFSLISHQTRCSYQQYQKIHRSLFGARSIILRAFCLRSLGYGLLVVTALILWQWFSSTASPMVVLSIAPPMVVLGILGIIFFELQRERTMTISNPKRICPSRLNLHLLLISLKELLQPFGIKVLLKVAYEPASWTLIANINIIRKKIKISLPNPIDLSLITIFTAAWINFLGAKV